MNELTRAVALLLALLSEGAAPTPDELQELTALRVLLTERSRASVDYHLTTRGQAALAREDAVDTR